MEFSSRDQVTRSFAILVQGGMPEAELTRRVEIRVGVRARAGVGVGLGWGMAGWGREGWGRGRGQFGEAFVPPALRAGE